MFYFQRQRLIYSNCLKLNLKKIQILLLFCCTAKPRLEMESQSFHCFFFLSTSVDCFACQHTRFNLFLIFKRHSKNLFSPRLSNTLPLPPPPLLPTFDISPQNFNLKQFCNVQAVLSSAMLLAVVYCLSGSLLVEDGGEGDSKNAI